MFGEDMRNTRISELTSDLLSLTITFKNYINEKDLSVPLNQHHINIAYLKRIFSVNGSV